jgi:fructose-bisphosphate aldolase class II
MSAVTSAKTTGLEAGVVTGPDYLTLVKACKDGGYALPAVNVVNTHGINAVLEAAAAAGSDVIIQLSGGGAQFFAGKGIKNSEEAKVLGAVSAARHVHSVARAYGICAVLHTDHANRKLIPWVEGMIGYSEEEFARTGRPLFSSHMLDLSEEPIEDNLAECARILKRLAPIDMSLEIELGVTGGEEDGVGQDVDQIDNSRLYTQPEDVMQAHALLSPIGHFSVAAAFGNVHGVYKPGNVILRPEILAHSQELARKTLGTSDKLFDFVFHGGSGSEKAKITEAVGYGVFKMNIDTDTQFVFAEAIGKYVEAHARAFKYQIDPDTDQPYKKQYDPREWLRQGELAIVERLKQAFDDLGSTGKSLAG